MSRMRSLYLPIKSNLTISVRYGYKANFAVDYRDEEYYTKLNKVKYPMRVDCYIKQEKG